MLVDTLHDDHIDPMAAAPTVQPIADMAVEGLAKVGGGATPGLVAIGPLKVRLLLNPKWLCCR